MSFTRVPMPPVRPARAVMVALGHDVASLETAARSSADMVMIEWEDGVPLQDKVSARRSTIDALAALDWVDKWVAVRVNALDSSETYRDLMELLESPATGRLNSILIPKPGVAADVYAVDVLVTQIERFARRPNRIVFELMIESAQGVCNLDQLATSSPRVEALHFGSVDFAASMRMHAGWGTPSPDYRVHGTWGDPWHATMVRIVTVARAYGLRALDGVHLPDPTDMDAEPDLLSEAARRAWVLGFDGKWAVTPDQVDRITEVFTPTPDDVARAASIVAAADEAGDAEPTLNGRALDPATIRSAQEVSELAARLGVDARRDRE